MGIQVDLFLPFSGKFVAAQVLSIARVLQTCK